MTQYNSVEDNIYIGRVYRHISPEFKKSCSPDPRFYKYDQEGASALTAEIPSLLDAVAEAPIALTSGMIGLSLEDHATGCAILALSKGPQSQLRYCWWYSHGTDFDSSEIASPEVA